jgi:carboxynorspermidine decarboxylase
MPDCLEMPYQPYIVGSEQVTDCSLSHTYRMGGNSCLSGDFVGSWQFDHELQIGERIVFEDMNHYTNVKTHMFNGITHPSIALRRLDGTIELLRRYTFEDYLHRMC